MTGDGRLFTLQVRPRQRVVSVCRPSGFARGFRELFCRASLRPPPPCLYSSARRFRTPCRPFSTRHSGDILSARVHVPVAKNYNFFVFPDLSNTIILTLRRVRGRYAQARIETFPSFRGKTCAHFRTVAITVRSGNGCIFVILIHTRKLIEHKFLSRDAYWSILPT